MMMFERTSRKMLLAVASFAAVTISFLSVPVASAATCQPAQEILNIPTWYKYLPGEELQGKCRPIIDDANSALPIGLAVFDIALSVAGLIAVVMIFWGSFKYVLTQGEPDKAAGARKTVINALVGLVITIVASRVVAFVGETLI